MITATGCDKSGADTTSPADAATAEAESHEGHDGHHKEGEAHDHGDVEGKEVVAAGEATVGDVTECPVSGEKFVVTDDSPSLEHEGKTFYFCCAGCHAKAQAEPEKYLTLAEPAE